ncbi:hypothetical protein [Cupriavidus taiwanensis]|uniref:Uncharacterized protein n=1 Tax=Cupriavidus taiwanensis TaxID=164546 RepID=A0A375J5H4_9BURK|nr:hypothetical protein [Cupriavidus taiwanensis]SPS00079.1 hypothetical protein CBM2634_B140091 [Cupriavidus taiwanensis]
MIDIKQACAATLAERPSRIRSKQLAEIRGNERTRYADRIPDREALYRLPAQV